MKHRIWIWPASLLLFGALGCVKDELTTEQLYIDAALQSYFDNFQEEAALRGITVDYQAAQVEGILTYLPNAIAGQCVQTEGKPSQIRIDQTIWSRSSTSIKEFLVFHELGHCILDRSHDDTRNTDGTCASIMHSGTTNCRNAYNATTRKAYLDELFAQ